MTKRGPLAGLRVVEMAGLAPAPFACMVLADLGAEVLRVDRAKSGENGAYVVAPFGPSDVLGRGRRSVALDLKHPAAVDAVLAVVEEADVLVEGFRPGVMERLGLGPDVCLARNPRLVYGRMTGWGGQGPLALTAGHDIDYIAVAGALHLIGRPDDKPLPPANLLGDFGGGGLLLAFGILAALYERVGSGSGQVVDAAMVDGAALLTTMLHGLVHAGAWSDQRGTNLLSGVAPFYTTYETADGGYMAVGAVEPEFYRELLTRIGAADVDPDRQHDRSTWPATTARFESIFRTRTRQEWATLLESSDACAVPVMSLTEAPGHPHNVARDAFVDVGGIVQPAPAPRFGRTPPDAPLPPRPSGGEGVEPLHDWGVPVEIVAALVAAGAAVVPAPVN
ncbi:MAG TPA: CaiB/BaiF CoA-transferase family protein [Acidimicrobiales bacterium]|nr:CaiB/BaiF CoA-transferase family protein [Acidimicrobiales bacterium]